MCGYFVEKLEEISTYSISITQNHNNRSHVESYVFATQEQGYHQQSDEKRRE